jgi:hypothetical protein
MGRWYKACAYLTLILLLQGLSASSQEVVRPPERRPEPPERPKRPPEKPIRPGDRSTPLAHGRPEWLKPPYDRVTAPHKSSVEIAREMYGQARQDLRAGDPTGAVQSFFEAYASAPSEATPETAALFKEAFFRAVDVNYVKNDWEFTRWLCEEIPGKHYFSITEAEQEYVSVFRSRAQNWSQAASLPGSTLVVDHFVTETRGSYFHVFGAGGAVDVLVKADTIRELMRHPDFRGASDRIAKGSDLLLTPSVTSVIGWQATLRDAFPDTVIWSDPYIGEASESLAALEGATITPADLNIAILLPKDAKQQAAMNLGWTESQRDHAWQAAEYLKSNARGASLITQSANRTGLSGWVTDLIGTDSKKELMHSLENSKGVLILFAHGDREGIYTPEGQKLTVRDIRGLNLHANRPVVLLLSCEGGAPAASDASLSLAQELKKSGATAIWSYGQKVDAAEASSTAVKFLENIGNGKTLLDSFRSLSRDGAVRAGPRVHLKVRLEYISVHIAS